MNQPLVTENYSVVIDFRQPLNGDPWVPYDAFHFEIRNYIPVVSSMRTNGTYYGLSQNKTVLLNS